MSYRAFGVRAPTLEREDRWKRTNCGSWPRLRAAVTAGVNGPRRSRLVTLVQRFVQADSWSASRVLVERHPALLSGDANDILTSLRALASARGDGAAVHTFEVHQALPRRYREVRGPAFDEVIAPGVPAALRPQWIAAEAAYERYRARPSRAAADSAIEDITPVLRHDDLAAVSAAARAGMQQAAGTLLGERYQRHGSSPADLDAAITCFTATVHDLPDNDPDRPSYTCRRWATSWECGSRNAVIPLTSTRPSSGPAC